MAEDLEGLLETSETGSETGATNESESQGTAPAPKVDLSKVPEYTRIQSENDTLKNRIARIETEKNQELELERQRREALEGLVNNLDPDMAKAVQAQLEKQAAETENAMLKQRLEAYEAREQQNDTRRAWEQAALEAGIDPASPKFTDAWNRAVARNTSAPLEAMLEVHAALSAAAPQAAPAQEAVVPAQPGKGYTLPPAGVPPYKPLSEADKEALNGRLLELLKDKKKNAVEIAAIKQKLGT